MSDESSSSSAPESPEEAPSTSPSLPPDGQPAVESLKLTRRQRHRDTTDEGGATLGDIDEAALLSVVLQSVERRRQGGHEKRPDRGPINRFVARAQNALGPGATAPSAQPPFAPGDSVSLPEADAPPSGAAVTPAATRVLPKFRPSTIGEPLDPAQGNAVGWARALLYLVAAAALIVAAYLAGRHASLHTVAPPSSKAPVAVSAVWLPAYSAALEKALASDHAGDLKGAEQLTTALAKNMEINPTLQAYRATLETRLRHFDDADSDLFGFNPSNLSPDQAATIATARGFNYVRWREFGSALDCFTTVALAHPFDVSNLLYWGETLRRIGSLPEAAGKFQEALNRLPVTSAPAVEVQREYIAYERRLTLVESGREADLEPELDQRLSAQTPSGYWLMTAAAVALQNGDMPRAVDALNKAQTVFSAEQFRALLSDYFFHNFTYHAEMTAFPFTYSPQQQLARQLSMDYFIDP